MTRYYKNRSAVAQNINTNNGRESTVQPREEVELVEGEEKSEEIVGKTLGSRPTGQVRVDESSPLPASKRYSSRPDLHGKDEVK